MEKVRVVMKNATVSADGSITYLHEAVDYVPVEQLEAYVADARTRWSEVVTDLDEGN